MILICGAIPFLDLWTGRVIYRGIIYSILMVLGKLLVGAVLLAWDAARSHAKHHTAHNTNNNDNNNHSTSTSPFPKLRDSDKQNYYHDADAIELGRVAEDEDTDIASSPSPSRSPSTSEAEAERKSSSFLAASFMGLAMVARGEIGILIAQVAYNSGQGSSNALLGTEAYLVSVWAIALCTIIGPLAVGFLAKHYAKRISDCQHWGAVNQPSCPST